MTETKIVIIISRHAPDFERVEFLKTIFGSDLQVLNYDIRYGENPANSILNLINEVEEEFDGKVVAVEPIAPFPTLVRILEARKELGVKILRAVFARDSFGRIIVTGRDSSGRDIFKFGRYEELVRIEFQVSELTPID